MRSLCSQIRHRSHGINNRVGLNNSQGSNGISATRKRNVSSDLDFDLETDSSSSEADFQHVSQSSSLHVGLLNEAVLDLKGLCHNMLNVYVINHGASGNLKTCPYCQNEIDTRAEEMTKTLRQKDSEIKRRDEEIANLQSQVHEHYAIQYPISNNIPRKKYIERKKDKRHKIFMRGKFP